MLVRLVVISITLKIAKFHFLPKEYTVIETKIHQHIIRVYNELLS